MSPLSARDLVLAVQDTLRRRDFDYEHAIEGFGQVAASEKRKNGHVFGLLEHLRGLLLSQLSNQRPWKQIAQNQEQIRTVFLDYDPTALQQADPKELETKIRAIRCSNRQIRKQLLALRANITTLKRIERDFGSLDNFVTLDEPDRIAARLSRPGHYKLIQVGYTLALEYLRNVGIRAGKPDAHIRRILGPERLAYLAQGPSEDDAYRLITRLASEAHCNATYFDNLLWIFCATGYGQSAALNRAATFVRFVKIVGIQP